MHELHEWNLALGRALMGDIAHFELALRNTYDRVLTERFEGGDHWLFDANSPVTRPIMRKSKAKKLRDVNLVNRRAVGDARGRAHDPANPDQVVAGLMLGFWAHMTDRSSERDLWIPYLHAAWLCLATVFSTLWLPGSDNLAKEPPMPQISAFPSIKALSILLLVPLNSTSLPWWTTLSIIAEASLSSPRIVPHLLNSMLVVNTTLRFS